MWAHIDHMVGRGALPGAGARDPTPPPPSLTGNYNTATTSLSMLSSLTTGIAMMCPLLFS